MTIESPRGEIEARARVTSRVRPLRVDGRVVHQVCMPWHWGSYRSSEDGVTGDAANDLIVLSGDPNTSIQESKAFACNVRAGRRRREPSERLAGAGAAVGAGGGADHEAEQPDRAATTEQSLEDEPR